ncbi:MAG: photosynthetic reaction center cytochrome c subunit [Acidobacteriia bacterium]|nr:photosynthetic reaction center cytochrome c subunit [Terriglobia bacterium]
MIKLVAVALAILPWAAAQTTPDFTGVWELNPAKSKSSGEGPDRMRVKIEHQGSSFTLTFRVTARGEIQQETQKYTIGQESKTEMHGASMTSHAEWDGATLAVRSVAVFSGKELKLADRWSLSADGNTLTFSERHQFGTEPEAEDIHTFERRPADSWEPDAQPKLSEEVYKNIQIMKGVPAPRLRLVMNNLTRWLGVDCAHCHVMGEFEKDDKIPKQTARNMFKMVRALGQDYFPGSNPVTCWTCHRGQPKPQSLPPQ